MSSCLRRAPAGRGATLVHAFAQGLDRRLRQVATAAAISAGLGAIAAAPAYAISQGCAAVNAGGFNVLVNIFTGGSNTTIANFAVGDTVSFNVTIHADAIWALGAGTNNANLFVSHVSTVQSYTVTGNVISGQADTTLTQHAESIDFVSSVAVTATCTPVAESQKGSDLGPAAKLLTQFVLNQILPDRAQTMSDLINERFSGNGSGPQVSSAAGSTRFRMSLADLKRMSRPQKDGAPQQSQWAGLPAGGADRTATDIMPGARRDRTGRDGRDGGDRADEQRAAAPAPAQTFRDGLDDTRWNLWASGDIIGVDVDRSGAAFSGRLYSVLGGVDYKVFEQFLIGVAGGWERYDLDTGFNGGTFKGTGYTVGPYLGFQLAPNLVLDVWGGWTRVSYDLTSRATGTTEAGAFDANRYFVSGNLTGRIEWGNLRVSPRVGVLYANERQPAYTSSLGNPIAAQTIELGKAIFGPEVAYRIALPEWRMTLEPFAFIRGEYDFVRAGSTTIGTAVIRPERWGARAGGGLNLTALDRISFRLGASYDSIGRSHEQVIRGEVRLGIRF